VVELWLLGTRQNTAEERNSDNRSISRMCKGKVRRIVCQKERIREATWSRV